MNARSGPKSAPAVVPTTTRQCTARSDNFPVTATYIVSFRDFEGYWPEVAPVRNAVTRIEMLPRGAHVRIDVADVAFSPWFIDGLKIDHVAITIESDNEVRLRGWVQGLREARG